MTVVFVTTVLPGANSAGGEICSTAFIDALRSAGHRVVVVGYRRKGDAAVAHDDVVEVASRRIETSGSGAWPVVWMAGAVARREPYSAAKFRSRAFRSRLRELLAAERPDAVVLDHAQSAWTLPRGGFGTPLVYIAHNVEHAMYRQAAEHSSGIGARARDREARLMEALEARLVGAATATWTLSDDDAAVLAELAGLRGAKRPRAFAVPPSPTITGAPVDDDTGDTADGFDVGLIGTWTWGPNAAGLRWFADEVHPLLPADLSVVVAGGGGDRIAPALEHRGRVPDAGAFLRSARVIACPSVQGGGVQVKTLDAIATGRPVVATSVALRGLPDPPETVAAADDAAGFAAALVAAAAAPPGGSGVARQWVGDRRERFVLEVAEAFADVTAR